MYNDYNEATHTITCHAPITPSMDNRRRALTSRNLQLAHNAEGTVSASGRDLVEEILGTFVSEEAVNLNDDRPPSSAWARPRRSNVTQHHGKAGETWRRMERDFSIHSGESE